MSNAFDKETFFYDGLRLFREYSNHSSMDTREILQFFTCKVDVSLFSQICEDSLSGEKLRTFTDLKGKNVNTLREMLTSMKISESRTVTQALVVFLFELRTGNSNDIRYETAYLAKTLFQLKENTLALIFGGTYVRHEKSNNNAYQRKSFSGQKKIPLCKPFTIYTTDGYTIDIAGPFNANMNDATIMKTLFEDSNELKSIMNKGICILFIEVF